VGKTLDEWGDDLSAYETPPLSVVKVCMHMCVYVCVCVCVGKTLDMYIYMYIYIYAHTYEFTYIHTYIHAQVNWKPGQPLPKREGTQECVRLFAFGLEKARTKIKQQIKQWNSELDWFVA
jgi:hypothetical protein